MSEREFRELGENHRVAFQEMVDQAFEATRGPTSYGSASETPDTLGRQFGVFEDGDLKSVCTHHDFSVSVRGEWQPMAGLASVATPPEHRREGLVTALVEASLRRWRGEYPIAALWPFEHGYYRQFGWATANTAVEYTCPPDALEFARGASDGTLRRFDPGDWERLQDVHEAHGIERGLTLRRDGNWWRRRVFRSIGGEKRFVYGLERDGRVDGYVAYTVENAGDGRRLRASDLAFRDRDAYLGLLALLADHDSQVSEIQLYREDERSLLDLVANPDAVECAVSAGPQVRIVDVERALSGLSYPSSASATLRLDVTDEYAPWNDGVVELRIEDGTATCRSVDDADVDAALDIGTLSQLYVGYHSAEDARRLAGLDADDETVASLADLFPTQTVYLRDYF